MRRLAHADFLADPEQGPAPAPSSARRLCRRADSLRDLRLMAVGAGIFCALMSLFFGLLLLDGPPAPAPEAPEVSR